MILLFVVFHNWGKGPQLMLFQWKVVRKWAIGGGDWLLFQVGVVPVQSFLYRPGHPIDVTGHVIVFLIGQYRLVKGGPIVHIWLDKIGGSDDPGHAGSIVIGIRSRKRGVEVALACGRHFSRSVTTMTWDTMFFENRFPGVQID